MSPAILLLLAVALVAYVYAGYPLIVWLRARYRPQPVRFLPIQPRVSVIIAAWNEAATIADKLLSVARQSYPPDRYEVIVACDGSTDDTPARAERQRARLLAPLTVVTLREHGGKAAALNAAVAAADGEILLFTDARQALGPDAMARLVEGFGDPSVGVVGGSLMLAADAPIGAYWAYESAVRRWESQAGLTIGVSGALYAIRKELFAPLPAGTILDDVLVPMRARLAGARVILDPLALAYDRAAKKEREFERKVRTLAGNLQLIALLPALLSPWRNPSFGGLVSHKLLRLCVPWALLLALFAAALLPEPWRFFLLGGQLVVYAAALWHWLGRGQSSRLARLCATAVVLNLAALVGTFRFVVRGRRLQW